MKKIYLLSVIIIATIAFGLYAKTSQQTAPSSDYKNHSDNMFKLIEDLNAKLLRDKDYGADFYGPMKVVNLNGIKFFLLHAEDQATLDYEASLSHMAKAIGLSPEVETWWIGGTLTGNFSSDKSKAAIKAIRTFLSNHFLDSEGLYRKDRMLISEYAGPEDASGEKLSAIRAIGKVIEKDEALLNNFIPYVVSNAGATRWFKSIGSIVHKFNHLFVVHGQRKGESDPWDSNGLARNGFILEGGSRTLGYIFEILGAGGKVIGIYGLNSCEPSTGKTCFMSASKFMSEFKDFLLEHPEATQDAINTFWDEYIKISPPFDPSASDAHTKQPFVDKAWEYYHTNNLRERIIENFQSYDVDEYTGRK